MNPVCWFEIQVIDMQRAVAFYEQVFGIELTLLSMPGDDSGMEMYVFPGEMEKAGISGALVKMDGSSSGPGGTLVYFECEDCEVEERKAEPAGGMLIQPKMDLGSYGFCSVIQDTEGNRIGLHSMR
jgi:predicted enzyme related to lactoylglutathione lyase